MNNETLTKAICPPLLPHDCIVWQLSWQVNNNQETRVTMSRNYKFHNPMGVYFVSFAVVEWIDVFTRNEDKDILLESLRYC